MPFIYYRDFNRIQARLALLPETRIVNSWRHADLTLEDFGFCLKVRECDSIRLDFNANDDWDRPFGGLDGFLFSTPYSRAPNGYQTKTIPIEELAKAGLRVHNLRDLVSSLEGILAYVEKRPLNPTDASRPQGRYLRVLYDLKA